MDDILKGNWKQLKGRIKQEWGDLTDNEIEQIEGSRDLLAGKIQERYGRRRQEAEEEVADWLERVTREL
jgi:uncharacterized protein YjbJ (UPF0337 family)